MAEGDDGSDLEDDPGSAATIDSGADQIALARTVDSGSAFAATVDSGVESGAAFAPTMNVPVHSLTSTMSQEVTREHPGRYSRAEELGRGGMGRVVLVSDTHLGREVAMKELLAQAGEGSAATTSVGVVTRFLREARVTGQLEHPSIVPVYELGRREDGTLYYTMKRIRGRSLASMLREAKTLEERLSLLAPFRDVCEAMAYAHTRGVVHRDLKPDNVMVGEFGETLVVDWGLAKVRGEDDPRAAEIERRVRSLEKTDAASTIDGHAIGTPAYMSPEQARGDLESIDERSDVWGLGAMLFEILTGRPPHTGEKAVEVLHKVLEERPPRVLEVCPEAPAELAAVADRALLRDPSSRYPGAAEVRREIVAFQDGRQVHAYDYSSLELVRRFVTRHKAASIAALSILVAAIAASVLVYGGYRTEREARRIAETRRDSAVSERERAETALRGSQEVVAEGLLERAEHALDTGDPSAAAIYAAGALLADPSNPSSPRAEGAASGEEARRARERAARAFTAYLDADEARRFVFVRRMEGANARGALSPDGRTLVFVAGRSLAIEPLSGGERRTLDLRADAVLAFLDADRVVLAGETPGVYALADGTRLAPLPEGTRHAAVRDGRLAVSTDAGAVVVLDATTYAELGGVEASAPSHLAWLSGSDARLAAIGAHHATVSFFAFPFDAAPAGLDLASPALALAASPDGAHLAVGLADPAIDLLAASPLAVARSLRTEGPVGGLAWLDSELLLSAEQLDRVVLRNVSSRHRVDTLHTPDSRGQRVEAGGPRGFVVALPAPTAERLVRASVFRWERRRQRRRRPLAESVRALALDPRGTRLIAATSRSIVAIPVTSAGFDEPTVLARLPERFASPVDVAVAPDGAIAVITSDASVLLLDRGASEPRVLEASRAPSACIHGLAFDRAGQVLFAADGHGGIRRWRRTPGQWLRPLEAHEGSVCALSVSPDSEVLASGSLDGTVRLWDVARGDPMRTIEHADVPVTALAFAPDGERIALGDLRGEVTLVRRSDGGATETFRAHDEPIHRLTFTSDGRRIATASDDGTVRFFDADGSTIRMILRTHGIPLDVEASPRGSALYTFDGREVVRVATDPSVDVRNPRAMLRVAEARAGLHLVGLELRLSE